MRPTFVNPGIDTNKNDYQRHYEQFIEYKEVGDQKYFIDSVETAEMLKGNTSEYDDELTYLKVYILYTRGSQNKIDYIYDEFLIPECLNFTKNIVSSRTGCFDVPPMTAKQYQNLDTIVGKYTEFNVMTTSKDPTKARLTSSE